MRFATTATLLLAGTVLGCKTEPTAAVEEDRWALHAIDGTQLPARPAALTVTIVGDTLQFAVQSSLWRPTPLARAVRWYQSSSAGLASEEVWYTYEAGLRSRFSIRGLCADGDLASCIDASGTAFVAGATLTIQFRDPGLGRLEYHRIR
jgi:hypothetical protein